MITILEGADGAGKTFLADQLAEHYGKMFTGTHHQGPFKKNVHQETLKAVTDILDDVPHAICDRLHLGERIYGPVFRDTDMLGEVGQYNLEKSLLAIGGVVQIICCPPFHKVEEAWLSRQEDEMLHSTGQLAMIYWRYKLQKSDLPTVRFDWTEHTFEWLLELIETIRSPEIVNALRC